MRAPGAEDGLGCVCGWDSGQEKKTCELLFIISCMHLLIYVRMSYTFAGISCGLTQALCKLCSFTVQHLPAVTIKIYGVQLAVLGATW